MAGDPQQHTKSKERYPQTFSWVKPRRQTYQPFQPSKSEIRTGPPRRRIRKILTGGRRPQKIEVGDHVMVARPKATTRTPWDPNTYQVLIFITGGQHFRGCGVTCNLSLKV